MEYLQNEKQFTEEEARVAVENVMSSRGKTNQKRYLPDGTRSPTTQKSINHGNQQLAMYQPCGCNSGKKFKWCCKDGKKEFLTIDTEANL